MKSEAPNLYNVLPRVMKQLDMLIIKTLSGCPKQINVLILDIVKPGKRLRPMLTILAAKTGDDFNMETVLKAAAAIELIHKASLLHDSVMDSHIDPAYNGAAVLAGDYLIARSLGLANDAGTPVVSEILSCMTDMIVGQAMQQDSRYLPNPVDKFYLGTVAKKTGSLFASACQVGARQGHGNQETIDKIRLYGLNFGIAFQIIDDINDKDIKAAGRAAAIEAAKQYFVLAAESINGLNASPAKVALQKLPAEYLSSAIH